MNGQILGHYSQNIVSGICVRPTIATVTNIDELCDYLNEHGTDGIDSTELPTFGGTEPADTRGVFSWDATNMLVERSSGWSIVPR